MDLVIATILGSCMGIALFLTPFLVILGWVLNVPMSLSKHYSSSCLTSRFPDFPGSSDFFVYDMHRIFNHGWEFKLDGRNDVVKYVRRRRDCLLDLS
jgi:hypothetical protein